MTPRFHSWSAPLQALALIVGPRLGLRQFFSNCNIPMKEHLDGHHDHFFQEYASWPPKHYHGHWNYHHYCGKHYWVLHYPHQIW